MLAPLIGLRMGIGLPIGPGSMSVMGISLDLPWVVVTEPVIDESVI
jgi:hypothetical protein